MEVDIKGELETLNKELRLLVVKLNELDRQRQAVANDILKKKGAIEEMQKLDTKKKAE